MTIATPVQDPGTLAWTFPESFTAPLRAQWEALAGEAKHHEGRVANAADKLAEALASPENLLASMRVNVEEAKRKADAAERRAKGELAWLAARASFGGDVKRIDMDEEGDVIIVRLMLPPAIDEANRRAESLSNDVLARVPAKATEAERADANRRALDAFVGAQKDALVDHATCGGLGKTESDVRLRALLARYYGLFARLAAVRDSMIQGFRVAEGKDSALS